MWWVQVNELGARVDAFDGSVFAAVQAELAVVGWSFGPLVHGHVDAFHERCGVQRFVQHENGVTL